MTICILFLQVFSRKKKKSGVRVFFSCFVVFFHIFFLFLRLQPALLLEGRWRVSWGEWGGRALMVFNPYMSPFADDSAGMVSERS